MLHLTIDQLTLILQIQGQLTICHKLYCDFIVWTECGLFVKRVNSDTI